MRTASQLLIASLASLSFMGTAVAQDAPVTDPATGEPAVGDPNLAPDGDANDQKAVAPVMDDAATTVRWPRDIISRVLTLPKGLAQVGVDALTSTSNFFDPALVRLLVGYGITDDFEINFGAYSFPTDDAGKGSLDVNVGLKLLRGAAGGKLEVIARAQTGYNLAGSVDLTTGDTEGAINPLLLGAHVQYNVTPKIAIISGAPTPQLSIGLDDVHPIQLALPISLGIQATPTLYLQADTSIGNLVLSDDDLPIESTFLFADSTPLFVAAYLNAVPALDVYVGLGSTNLTPPDGVDLGDTLVLGLGARYYIGQL